MDEVQLSTPSAFQSTFEAWLILALVILLECGKGSTLLLAVFLLQLGTFTVKGCSIRRHVGEIELDLLCRVTTVVTTVVVVT